MLAVLPICSCHPIMSTKQLNRWPVFLISSPGSSLMVLYVMWSWLICKAPCYAPWLLLCSQDLPGILLLLIWTPGKFMIPFSCCLSAMLSMTTFIVCPIWKWLTFIFTWWVMWALLEQIIFRAHTSDQIPLHQAKLLSTDDLPSALIVMQLGIQHHGQPHRNDHGKFVNHGRTWRILHWHQFGSTTEQPQPMHCYEPINQTVCVVTIVLGYV